MPDSARQAIFTRIGAAIGNSREPGAMEWETLDRSYIRNDSLPRPEVIDLFEHRLLDYGAHVFRARADQVAEKISQILGDRGAHQIIIPKGFVQEWLPGPFVFTEDLDLPFEKLDLFDGVLTTSTVAIATTGSIVLQHGPGEGRRAVTLIPDYHLCIVDARQIVETVPAAFSRLDPRRPTTFISGPSATADIEMTRIKGVHGPRFMDVILIEVQTTG